MDALQAILLALVQGVTEFLPISSSAHLILPAALLGWPDQGLAFDVAVHLGSLCAVLVALRGELTDIVRGSAAALTRRRWNDDARLAAQVVVATLPVVAAGLLLKDLVAGSLRTPLVIATTTIVFGLALWWADAHGRRHAGQARSEFGLRWRDALLIGAAQCLALVPGTSRSGITMTVALLLGLSRTASARFSFLLSIPTIAGAALLSLLDLLEAGAAPDWRGLAIGLGVSAVAAWACIRFFLALLERTGFGPYVAYRLVLGALLFALFL